MWVICYFFGREVVLYREDVSFRYFEFELYLYIKMEMFVCEYIVL